MINDLSSIDTEIDASLLELNNLKFTYSIKINAVSSQDEEIEFDLSQMHTLYDETKGQPIENLNIELENNPIKRFSCAAHKLNLALRHAFELHHEFNSLIDELSSFCSTMRNSKEYKEVS